MNTPEHQQIPDQSEQETHVPKFRVRQRIGSESFKVIMLNNSLFGRLLKGDTMVVYDGFAYDRNDAISRAISALKTQETEKERKRQSTINPDTLEVSGSGPDLLSTLTGRRRYTGRVLTSFPEWITVVEGRFRDRSDAARKAEKIIQQRLKMS